MKQDKSTFSLKARAGSFRFAWQGLRRFFSEEHNAIIHAVATVVVIVLSLVFPVSGGEAALLVLAAGFVWAAELFNTAVEKLMDYLSAEKHPAIKYIKDLAAGAVLLSALTALLAALFIFIPKC